MERKQLFRKADQRLSLGARLKSWPSPTLGELPGIAYADLGVGLTSAPGTGLACPCTGTAQAMARSRRAEDELHLLQHTALPSNTAEPNGITPMDFMQL